jgi:hypothetical protein
MPSDSDQHTWIDRMTNVIIDMIDRVYICRLVSRF